MFKRGDNVVVHQDRNLRVLGRFVSYAGDYTGDALIYVPGQGEIWCKAGSFSRIY